jgi:hypothetical protein
MPPVLILMQALLGVTTPDLRTTAAFKANDDGQPRGAADQQDVSQRRNTDPPPVGCPPPRLNIDSKPQDGSSDYRYDRTTNAYHVIISPLRQFIIISCTVNALSQAQVST